VSERVYTRLFWGIQHRSALNTWGGALGQSWMEPKVATHPYLWNWPAVFESRREAREMAKRMTEATAYLGPSFAWRYRPLRLSITVRHVQQAVASGRAPKVARKAAGSSRRRKG
jgi:hypothetical protein